MAIKRKDFQKTAAYIHQFLLKLDFSPECAEVRDALNLALLYMQKYYRCLRRRIDHKDRDTPTLSNSSTRGFSPMTPCGDLQDKFQWRWQEVEGKRYGIAATQDAALQSGAPLSVTVSKNGDLETLKALYRKDRGCIDEADCLGRTPLMYAVQHSQYTVAEWLLRSGASVNACAHDRSTALHVAVSRGLCDLAELLVKYDAALDEQDAFGRAPMHWAVTTATTECLKLLLRRSADPRVRDNDLATPAMWACRLDRMDHFTLLGRAAGVGDDERDSAGRTFVHWAVRRQEPLECLKTLLTADNAVASDQGGKNVLMIAAEQGSLPACKIVLDVCRGSSGGSSSSAAAKAVRTIDQRDQDLRTAAHLATLGGHGEVLNYLLDNGADLELRDRESATIWDYAKQRHLNYCKLIIASHWRQRCKDGDSATAAAAAAAAGAGLDSMRDQLRASMPTEMSPRPPAQPPLSTGAAARVKSPSPLAARRHLRSVGAAASPSSRRSSGENWAEASGGFDRKESEDNDEELATDGAIPDPLLGLVGMSYSLSGTTFATIVGSVAHDALAEDHHDEVDPASEQLLPPPPQFQAEEPPVTEAAQGSSPGDGEGESVEAQQAAAGLSPRPLSAQLVPLGFGAPNRLPDVGGGGSGGGGGGSGGSVGSTARKKKKKKQRAHSSSLTPAAGQNGFSGPSPAAPLLPPGSHMRPLSPRSQLLDGTGVGTARLGHQRLSDLPPPVTPRSAPYAPLPQPQPPPPLFGGGGIAASAEPSTPPPTSPAESSSAHQGKGIFFPVPGKPRPTWLAGHGRGAEQPQ